ncbi:helix-turn-helix domain-containing protein [Collimonas sp.]|uniref:helix-turn-helix domain-containing protein n=1 Tax=Collimonas sp. TaxID=1963772 RepID=UPI0037BE7B83
MSESEQLKSKIVDEVNAESVSPQVAGVSPASLGAQLASKREQLGVSIAEVSSYLKLAPRQIEAIEVDNYAALPTMVMTRGFIRSYAKLLGLDPTVLLAQISPAAEPKELSNGRRNQLSTPFPESRFTVMGRTRFAYKWLIAGAVVLLLLAVGMRLDLLPMVGNALHPAAEKTTAAATPCAASGKSSTELPLSPSAAEASATKAPADAAPVPVPVPVVNAAAVTVANGGDAPVSAPANATTAVPAAPQGANGNQLSLNFRQDSWVEIKRADNSVLISRLVKAGDSQSFDITQPVSVTIGNLDGVDAMLRGQPLDLKATSKTNVARLNLK